MTPTEALARLGLDPAAPSDPAALRRAYLQAVKRHKPEVDPEGFQEVRAAYELLQEIGDLAAFTPEPMPAPATLPLLATAPAAMTAADASGEPPADDAADEVTEEPPHLAPYLERIQARETAPWPDRAKIAWEAYRAFPGDAAARELLLSLLPPEARGDITQILREGAEAGDAFCLWRLLRFAPEAVPEAQLEQIERGSDQSQRLAAVRARIERDEAGKALVSLDALTTVEAGQLPQPAVLHAVVESVLRFEALSDPTSAVDARRMLRRYLGSDGLVEDIATTRLAALYLVATDLGACDFLPIGLRREIARGALEGNVAAVQTAILVAERDLGTRAVQKILKRLATEVPGLHSLIGAPRLRTPWHKGWWRSPLVWRLAPVVLIVMIRLGLQASDAVIAHSPDVHGSAIAPATQQWLRIQISATNLCQERKDQAACEGLPDVWSELGAGECRAAAPRIADLLVRAETEAMRDLLRRLQRELPGLCDR